MFRGGVEGASDGTPRPSKHPRRGARAPFGNKGLDPPRKGLEPPRLTLNRFRVTLGRFRPHRSFPRAARSNQERARAEVYKKERRKMIYVVANGRG